MASLPTVSFGEHQISRLICGGNPFRGNSHLRPDVSRAMRDYFTVARVKETLHACQRAGINTVQARGDALIQAIVREFRAEGGQVHWIAQTASELRDLRGHVRGLAGDGAIGIYAHGTWVDNHFLKGEYEAIVELLKDIRDAGVQVGLGTHRPDVIAHAEEHGWDIDFYMACLYNLSRTPRESSLVGHQDTSEKELFLHEDKWAMFDLIRQTEKTCLAFKVLGAGRLCNSPEEVRAAFETAYQNIKPKDAIVVGMWPQARDQVSENVRYTQEILSEIGGAAPA